jgi:hypothetical protein
MTSESVGREYLLSEGTENAVECIVGMFKEAEIDSPSHQNLLGALQKMSLR